MSATSDWRSAQATDAMKRLERPGFAAEFLRRSPAYRTDYTSTRRRIAAGAAGEDRALAALARRWGLSFPFRPSGRIRYAAGLLATAFVAHHGVADRSAVLLREHAGR
jgi:hypothetical protein